jgi:hypothetical protein
LNPNWVYLKMKVLFLLCAGLLLIGMADLPIGYYTLLRIVVTIGAIAALVQEFKGDFNFWVIAFGVVAIIFNPLIPVYLHSKNGWQPIDLSAAVLFIIQSLRKPIK